MVALLVLTSLVAGAAQPARIDAAELKRLQGDWQMVGLESNAKKFADDELPVLALEVKGETWTIQLRNGGSAKARIVLLDPKSKPARISLEIDGSTYHAVYRLEKDMLISNIGDAGDAAPPDFRPTKSNSGGVSTYRRKAKQ